MDRFVHDQNVVHLKSQLDRTLDQELRGRILALLAKEQAKVIHDLPERGHHGPVST